MITIKLKKQMSDVFATNRMMDELGDDKTEAFYAKDLFKIS